MVTENDLTALNLFLSKYPTWWYTIGHCNISRDFSCAPQHNSPEIKNIKEVNDCWDSGFHCDHKGSIADAIMDVMEQIKEAEKGV